MTEIVDHGRTGFHFTPGSDEALAAAVDRCWPSLTGHSALAREARAEFEARYTPKRNYEALIRIYNVALSREGPSR